MLFDLEYQLLKRIKRTVTLATAPSTDKYRCTQLQLALSDAHTLVAELGKKHSLAELSLTNPRTLDDSEEA